MKKKIAVLALVLATAAFLIASCGVIKDITGGGQSQEDVMNLGETQIVEYTAAAQTVSAELTAVALTPQPATPEPTQPPEVTPVPGPEGKNGEPAGQLSKWPDWVLKWRDPIMNNVQRIENEKQLGIDPNILASIVFVQSNGGDPNYINPAGGVGLMGVMPRDGKGAEYMCGEQKCFANRPTVEELQNSEFNIKYATDLLVAYLTDEANSDKTTQLEVALLTYYCGDDALRNPGSCTPESVEQKNKVLRAVRDHQ